MNLYEVISILNEITNLTGSQVPTMLPDFLVNAYFHTVLLIIGMCIHAAGTQELYSL